jgi:hypothetical protein
LKRKATTTTVLAWALYSSALEHLIKRTPGIELLGHVMSTFRSPNIRKTRRTRTFIRYATRRPTLEPRNIEGQEHLGIQIRLISPYHRTNDTSHLFVTRLDLTPRTRSSMRSDIHLEISNPKSETTYECDAAKILPLPGPDLLSFSAMTSSSANSRLPVRERRRTAH